MALIEQTITIQVKRRGMGLILCLIDKKTYLEEVLS